MSQLPSVSGPGVHLPLSTDRQAPLDLGRLQLPTIAGPDLQFAIGSPRRVALDQAVTALIGPERFPLQRRGSKKLGAIESAIAAFREASDRAAALSFGVTTVTTANNGVRRITQGG